MTTIAAWLDRAAPAAVVVDMSVEVVLPARLHGVPVVTHADQNALAEVAAVRRPAIVVPRQRPHDEQTTAAAVLDTGRWPAFVAPG